MKTLRDHRTTPRIALLLLAVLLPALSLFAQAPAAKVLVIVNQAVGVTAISKSDLRDIFTGVSTSLKESSNVTPVLLKEGAVHEEMLSLYIGKSDAAFRASWRSLLFSGQGVIPKTMDSEAAAVDYVARTPGAIGYIGISTPHPGVKTLAIN